MRLAVHPDPAALGAAAAAEAADLLRQALARQPEARLILATGASQFEMLARLVRAPDLDWSRVTCFHLDEYAGLPDTHPASFRRYLRERFVAQVPGLQAFVEVRGDAPDLAAECRRLGELVSTAPIDVACVGIGENGHLAFNDPPADLDTEEPFLVVTLDEACRRQQLGEGWFPDLDAVPRQALSMSIRQILKSRALVVSVPDARKAAAVKLTLTAPIGPDAPASVLREHPRCSLHLDQPAAGELPPAMLTGG